MPKTAALVLVHLVLATVLLTAPAAADDPAATTGQAAPSPMVQEIRQALDASRVRVQELGAALENATDEAAALEILKQIRQAKQDAEIAVMRIQLRRAVEAGDAAVVAEIETAIERILAPEPALPTPQARAERELRRPEANHD